MINRFAGSRSDPAKIASSTAGAAGNDNRRNDIIVRGNSPLGVLWRVEEVDLNNPNHFTVAATGGGVFSILNSNVIRSCDFITGAFPAEYGNKTAAVFDIQLRNGNSSRNENTFQIGLNGIEFSTEGPISLENGSSYLINARAMSLRPVKALGVDLSVTTEPEFMDAMFKVNLPTESMGNFTIWGIGGYCSADVKNSEDDDIDWNYTASVEDENIRSSMYAVSIANTHIISPNSFGKIYISNNANIIHTFNEFVLECLQKIMTD